MRSLLTLALLVTLSAAPALAQSGSPDPSDPYIWLEEVEGEAALEWAEQRSARAVAALQADTAFANVYRQALEVFSSNERIAYPRLMGDYAYNLWQDSENPRGIWRRMSRADYLAGSEAWETVLDVDRLAAEEGVNWVLRGQNCLAPDFTRCLISLSRGGADAAEVREFDLTAKAFVPGGFVLPEAKSNVSWRDANALYVATDTGEGSMTPSGYPRTVRIWQRGTDFAEAPLFFEGEPTDMSVSAFVRRTPDSELHFLSRSIDFWNRELHVIDPETNRTERLAIPTNALPTWAADQLLLRLRTAWTPEGTTTTYPQGALISIGYDDFLAGGRDFEVVVEPSDRTTVRQVSTTANLLLVSVLEDVQGRLYQFSRDGDRWVRELVPAPEFGVVGIAGTADEDDTYLFTYQNFLQPTTLYVRPDPAAEPQALRQQPAFFDAEPYTVEQLYATSADGTRIPYFVLRRADAPMDGSNPTHLYAYGGFEVSMTPGYSATLGTTWLNRGGIYVLANIRGGGEFGPAWHHAALRENRQRAFDDFIAVAEDLIERGFTTPERLGVSGGSNGGLLIGAVLTQRPDLFGAAISAVPLLDMRRYHYLLAGASWMAEYGDPDNPDDWAFIQRYSPYHNVSADARYPRTFIYTSTRDDRVHPGHARKMAALMEDLGHDVLYYENTEGGHAAAVTPEQQAFRAALTTTYLLQQLRDLPNAEAAHTGTH